MKTMAINSHPPNDTTPEGWVNDTKQYHHFLPAFNTQYLLKRSSHTWERWIREQKKSMQSTVKYSFHYPCKTPIYTQRAHPSNQCHITTQWNEYKCLKGPCGRMNNWFCVVAMSNLIWTWQGIMDAVAHSGLAALNHPNWITYFSRSLSMV